MPLPGSELDFRARILGVSEDYDPTIYGYYHVGICCPDSASAHWLSPMYFYYRCGSFCYVFLVEPGCIFAALAQC